MVAILFYVKYDKESQMAYKDLMNSSIKFKTFEIRGKNVSERLKSLGITQVPTFIISSKKQKIQGYIAIKKMIDKVEQYQMRMKHALRQEKDVKRVKVVEPEEVESDDEVSKDDMITESESDDEVVVSKDDMIEESESDEEQEASEEELDI